MQASVSALQYSTLQAMPSSSGQTTGVPGAQPVVGSAPAAAGAQDSTPLQARPSSQVTVPSVHSGITGSTLPPTPAVTAPAVTAPAVAAPPRSVPPIAAVAPVPAPPASPPASPPSAPPPAVSAPR
jgi:hypothetical protein